MNSAVASFRVHSQLIPVASPCQNNMCYLQVVPPIAYWVFNKLG
jgi:hypothetical protein